MNLFIDSNLKAFNLNANEALVYSAIAAVSKTKGWYATYESLVNHLPCVVSTKTVERAIRHLTELGLIQKRQNALLATNCLSPSDKLPAATDKLSATDRQTAAPRQTNSPSKNDKLSPIYNKENKEKREENSIPSTSSSFDKLLAAFKAKNANITPTPDILATSRNLWEELPDYRQQQLIDAVEKGLWNKDRLDWLIQNFKFREPVNYAGLQAPRGAILYQVPIAPGKKAVYTIEDVKEFHIPNAKFYMKVPL